jgi:hypothetical protein
MQAARKTCATGTKRLARARRISTIKAQAGQFVA